MDRIHEAYIGKMGNTFQKKTQQRIHWIVENVKGDLVLDVGCSQGIAPILMGKNGFKVTGLDVNADGIEYAKNLLSEQSESVQSRVTFLCKDFFDYKSEAQIYDTVIFSEVLEHILRPEFFVEKAYLLLKNEGRIIITVPFGINDDPDHVQTFYYSKLQQILSQYFDIATVKTFGKWIGFIGQKKDHITEATEEYNIFGSVEEEFYNIERGLIDTNNSLLQQRDCLKKEAAKIEEELREGLSNEIKEKSQLMDTISTTQAEKALLEVEITKWEEKSKKSAAELESSKEENSTLNKMLSRANSAYEKKELEFNDLINKKKAADEACYEATLSLEKSNKSLAAAEATVVTLQNENQSLKRQNESLEKEIAELKIKLRNTQLSWKTSENNYQLLANAKLGRFTRWYWKKKDAVILFFRKRGDRFANKEMRKEAKRMKKAQKKLYRDSQGSILRRIAKRSKCLVAVVKWIRNKNPDKQFLVLPIDRLDYKLPTSISLKTSEPLNKHEATPITKKDFENKSLIYEKAPAKNIEELRIGAIMDTFSLSCFSHECSLLPVRVDNWQDLFEEETPDLMLVESAWNGNDGAWQYRIGTYSGVSRADLFELLDYCKSKDIPTVFWNKEDPPHFDKFIEAASRFDYVFTTDENCIPKYRQRCGHERVYALPFAAQPSIHNPVLCEDRDKNICFAGTYYASRFPERKKQMDILFAASEGLGLDIYDRMYGNTSPGYQDYLFPEPLRKYILGRLEYDDMVKAYRRYKVFLNVNSVTDSGTMFSRRVFELLACGTPVVTTPSKGIKAFFGSLVPEITSIEEGHEILKSILEDNTKLRRIGAEGVRCVHSKHTYRHRLQTISEIVGLNLKPLKVERVAVLVFEASNVENVIQSINAQSLKPEWIMLINGKAVDAKKIESATKIAVRTGESFSDIMSFVEECKEATGVAVFNGNDTYTSEYLSDASLALSYCGCDSTGMASVVDFSAGINTIGDVHSENHIGKPVYVSTLFFRKNYISRKAIIEAAATKQKTVHLKTCFARYSFEYGANAEHKSENDLKTIIL